MLTARNTTRYGCRRDALDHRDHLFPMRRMELPASVDLRPGCPAVYEQGRIGSCTAQAVAAAIEFELIRLGANRFTPSRLFIYWNERAIDGTTLLDAGSQIRDGVKVAATLGVPPETVWPYDDTPAGPDGQFSASSRAGQQPPAYVYEAARHHEAVRYHRVPQDLDNLRSVLARGFPIAFGFTVCEAFESNLVAATGVVPMPEPGDVVLGGHAVLLVGYDDSQRRFLVRNSWGTRWGKEGYFTMPYDYVCHPNLAHDFWTISALSDTC